MMKYSRYLLFLVSFLVMGCLRSFPESVVIHSDQSAKFYIENKFVGEGDSASINTYGLSEYPQIRIEADSCKKEYSILSRYRTSTPFSPLKYHYRKEHQKKLYLDKVSMRIKEQQSHYRYYRKYNKFLKGFKPNNIVDKDSVYYKYTVFESDLAEVLTKLNFMDSTSTVLVDNINTLRMSSEIERVKYYTFRSNRKVNRIKKDFWIVRVHQESNWALTDIYGDTLCQKRLASTSGIINSYYNEKDQYYNIAISDALEISMQEFINSDYVKKELRREDVIENNEKPIAIMQSTKPPTDAEQAIRAAVTIKIDAKRHGSGFVVSQDGYIITNYHIISGDDIPKVLLNDGTELDLEIVSFDKSLNLALLKVDHNFEFAFLIADENKAIIGEKVYAVGTPRSIELGQSITRGIVSGIRTKNDRTYIQTDIMVNYGNSGGAIINKNAELIGVVEYKLLGYGVEGISFGIPASDLKKSLNIIYK